MKEQDSFEEQMIEWFNNGSIDSTPRTWDQFYNKADELGQKFNIGGGGSLNEVEEDISIEDFISANGGNEKAIAKDFLSEEDVEEELEVLYNHINDFCDDDEKMLGSVEKFKEIFFENTKKSLAQAPIPQSAH